MKPAYLFVLTLFSLTVALGPAQACERDRSAASCETGYVWDDGAHACVPQVAG